MNPLVVHLFFMLEKQSSVCAHDLCPWDEDAAEEVLAQARCYQHASGLWAPTEMTRVWSVRTIEAIKREMRNDDHRRHRRQKGT